MDWKDIAADPQFQQEAEPVKLKIADNYYNKYIKADPGFQQEDEATQKKVYQSLVDKMVPSEGREATRQAMQKEQERLVAKGSTPEQAKAQVASGAVESDPWIDPATAITAAGGFSTKLAIGAGKTAIQALGRGAISGAGAALTEPIVGGSADIVAQEHPALAFPVAVATGVATGVGLERPIERLLSKGAKAVTGRLARAASEVPVDMPVAKPVIPQEPTVPKAEVVAKLTPEVEAALEAAPTPKAMIDAAQMKEFKPKVNAVSEDIAFSSKPAKVKIMDKILGNKEGVIGVKRTETPSSKMTDIDPQAKKMHEVFERQEDAINDLKGGKLKKVKMWLNRNIVDTSGNLKLALEKTGRQGREVIMNHDLIAGTTAKAMMQIEKQSTKMIDGLDAGQLLDLNRMIQSKRMLAINDYLGPEFKHVEGADAEMAHKWINSLDPEYRNMLNERSDYFFTVMREELDKLKAHGLIDEDSYKRLYEKGDYAPRELLDYVDPGSVVTDASKKITVGDSGLKNLKQGDLGYLNNNAQKLLAQVVSRTEGRIARNAANTSMVKLAISDPMNGVVRIVEKESPVMPSEEAINVILDGKKITMAMPKDIAREWVTSDPVFNHVTAQILQWLSGTKILKAMATGLNPAFAITNFPRDIAHIWLTTPEYAGTLPKAAWQMSGDFKTVLKDALYKKGRYKDYVNEGGGMEFLAHQGAVFKGSGPLGEAQKFFGWAGETSEILARLMLRERALKNGASAKEATWIARNYLDFSQGGKAVKAFDNVLPYLNAGTQGTRGIFRAMRQNPKLFNYKVAQLMGVSAMLYGYNRFNNPEAWRQVPERERINNFIIIPGTSYIDEDGNKRYHYIKIPKDQGQRFFTTVTEAAMSKAIGDDTYDAETILQSVKDAIPMLPGDAVPPVVDAFVGYAANKDLWRNEDIWKATKFMPHGIDPSEEYLPAGQTHPFFVRMGQHTGMSPERLKYSMSQFFTRGNIFTSGLGVAYNLIDPMDSGGKDETLGEFLSTAPFTRRVWKAGSPHVTFRETVEEETRAVNTKNFKIKRDFNALLINRRRGNADMNDLVKFMVKQTDPNIVDQLVERFDKGETRQFITNNYIWDTMQYLPAEARANVFRVIYDRADNPTKMQLMKDLGVSGLATDDFTKYFGSSLKEER